MSLSDDMTRNRLAYRRLTGQGAASSPSVQAGEPGPVRTEVFEEGGAVPDLQFERAVQRVQEQSQPRAVYSLRHPPGFAEQGAGVAEPVQAAEPEPPAEVSYPAPGADQPAAQSGDGDLLDSLLRKLEANARRLPQELSTEGDAMW